MPIRLSMCGPCIVAAFAGHALAQATFQPLGIPAGFTAATVSAISADGSALVGTASGAPVGGRGFRWTAGAGFQFIAPIPGHLTTDASIVSADGNIVMGRSRPAAPEYQRVVRWSPGVGTSDAGLGSLALYDGSDDLSVVCGHTGIGAFYYLAPYEYDLGEPSSLVGVSADGSVIAGDRQPAGGLLRLFPQAGGSWAFAGPPPAGTGDYAGGISGDARVIVGWLTHSSPTYGEAAMVWTEGLGHRALPAGSGTDRATGASRDATVIVGYSGDGVLPRASLWVNGSYRDVLTLLASLGATGLEGWSLRNAVVSSDGRTIAGFGVDPAGHLEPWRATLPSGFGCYANCDGSTAAPALNVADFSCFLVRFGAGDWYANCDGSTAQPVLNVADFSCFLQKFGAGCP